MSRSLINVKDRRADVPRLGALHGWIPEKNSGVGDWNNAIEISRNTTCVDYHKWQIPHNHSICDDMLTMPIIVGRKLKWFCHSIFRLTSDYRRYVPQRGAYAVRQQQGGVCVLGSWLAEHIGVGHAVIWRIYGPLQWFLVTAVMESGTRFT